MTKNLNIINWQNVLAHSKTFQDQKSTKWVFLEEFFVRDFYEKLYAPKMIMKVKLILMLI